jgi:hypothetical protein
MVQKRVQKVAQSDGDGAQPKDDLYMPQFLFKSPRGTGYLFRRGVPADVRHIIGKREFNVVLGGDHRNSVQRCRELAVETDQQIAAARAGLTSLPGASGGPSHLKAESSLPLAAIHEITPELVQKLQATVVEQVLAGYKQRRYSARETLNLAEELNAIERVRNLATLAWAGDDTAITGWTDMLTNTLARNGYCLAQELENSQKKRELLIEYATAYRDGLDIVAAEYSGKAPSVRFATLPLLRTEPLGSHKGEGMLLSAALKEFLAHLPPSKRAMNEKHGFILPAFLEIVGDMQISDLRQNHVKDFLVTVQKLPPRWSDLRRKEKVGIRDLAARTLR